MLLKLKNIIIFGAKMFGIILAIIFVFNLFSNNEIYLGGGMTEFSSYAERDTLYKNILDKATNEQNPNLCSDLPLVGGVYENHGWGNTGFFTVSMRHECLKKYADKYQDVSACLVMEKTVDKAPNNYESSRCIQHLAEITNNESLCDLAKHLDTLAECHAIVGNDISYCYNHSKDEYDTSRYSRAVGFCIGNVVSLKSKDYKSCLKIDGIDYGEQWWIQRNECLGSVASYLEQNKKDFKFICDSIITNFPTTTDRLFYIDEKERCKQGYPGGFYFQDVTTTLNW